MAQCLKCRTAGHKTLFRYYEETMSNMEHEKEEYYKVFILKEGGKEPPPRGVCIDCFKEAMEKLAL